MMLSHDERIIFREMLDMVCTFKEHSSKINGVYMYSMNQGMDYHGDIIWSYIDRYQLFFREANDELDCVYYVTNGQMNILSDIDITLENARMRVRKIYELLILLMNYNVLELKPKMREDD